MRNRRITRRGMLKSAAAGAAAAATLFHARIAGAASAPTPVKVRQKHPGEPRIRGPFPILSTPFTTSGDVDYEVLARQARFLDWCESPGMIWPQSGDSVSWLTQDEKLEGMEVLAKTSRKLKTALCLGVQGKDTDEMLVYARHAEKLAPAAIISRPPDTGKTQEDLRQYWRALAEVTKRPVIIQTTGDGKAAPSIELLAELAEAYPNFGYIKEEANPVIARTQQLLASPSIRRVFSARGAFGWLYETRLGTEGLITERVAYADALAKIWRLMESGDDPDSLRDMYSKLLLMWNLKDVDLGNLRGYNLHLLKRRGVFDNTLSRHKLPTGSKKDSVRDLTLSPEAVEEVEWRFESLRPYLKPGRFEG